MLLTSGRLDNIVQFITVLILFIFVLALTYFTTKFVGGFQKSQTLSPNMDVVETMKIAQNKYIQIVRVGETYFSFVVCKDTVTLLGEISKDEITIPERGLGQTVSFQEILDKTKNILQHKK